MGHAPVSTPEPSREFLSRQFWIWPLIAALLLAVVGRWIRTSVEAAMRTTLADEVQTLLNADVAALRIWMKLQESNAENAADDLDVRRIVRELVALGESPGGTAAALMAAPQLSKLREELNPWLDTDAYLDFALVGPQRRILAASRDELIGKETDPAQTDYFRKVFSGKSTVSYPVPSVVLLKDSDGESRVGVPTMFASAPVFDDDEKAIAVLSLRLSPEHGFTRILQVARMGKTGETYAFDRKGRILSESRFTDDLVDVGLISARPVARSTLNLELRDPQVDLISGARSPLRRADQPLTRMVASAVRGESGVDADGYRDYRGVMVIGAWTWLDDYEFGVANEVDMSEAYEPLQLLPRVFWGLFSLLALSGVGLCAFSVAVARLKRSARRSALEAKQLGQYVLDEKIGAGGMGTVYRAHHAMLRRPTAVKLLQVDKMNDNSIRRFEREVRLTCGLNHPNTIAIYDYGRTPDGMFYYAMEFLDGLSLQELVDCYGTQDEGRVIAILRQVCGSLAEAHEAGLVHRDIKPANIMLNQRGGLFDFVKVLDFGLVRSDNEEQMTLTAAGSLTGTPLYMSPEAIERPKEVDARSDLYAVGAVGYFLLTGRPVFTGQNVLEVCMQHSTAAPVAPSVRRGKPVLPELEAILMRCLAKRQSDRPPTARLLAAELESCAAFCPWTERDAERWWREHAKTGVAETLDASPPATADNQMLSTFVPVPAVEPAPSTEQN